jgi:hypothetical protein
MPGLLVLKIFCEGFLRLAQHILSFKQSSALTIDVGHQSWTAGLFLQDDLEEHNVEVYY